MAAQITVPVHVMAGERSPASPHQVAVALAEVIPGATHEPLAGQGHMVSAKLLLPRFVHHLSNRDPHALDS
ncbi:alpha/beta fold hydrolase [Microbacterium halotolerans]|uniref:alpha/beta fold hydrolase n=1 Tax=Microbacterium halotolerans TaxID=246613 RepID=UPI000E6AB5BA|nr:hypothetical protein [Microbacterium halotolerans]